MSRVEIKKAQVSSIDSQGTAMHPTSHTTPALIASKAFYALMCDQYWPFLEIRI
jgi:hypothetical protein